MVRLEIRYRSGKVETHELSDASTLLVGQNPSNDICIDDPDVAPFHCRIGWHQGTFQVTAATPTGVQRNGSTVSSAALSHGDIVRVGDVDLVVIAEQQPSGQPLTFADVAASDSSLIALKALSGENEIPLLSRETTRPPESNLPAAVLSSQDMPPNGPNPQALQVMLEALDKEEPKEVVPPPSPADVDGPRRRGSPPPSLVERTQRKLGIRAVRPGEQQTLRSPLVLGLGGGVLILALAATAMWLFLG